MGTRLSTRRTRPLSRVLASLRLVVTAITVALVLSSCGSGATVPDEVRAQLDTEGQRVAVLGSSEAEAIDEARLAAAVDEALAAGADLRVVVSGDAHDVVDPTGVANHYGGTAITFKAGADDIKAASGEIDADELTRTIAAASRPGMAETISAFASQLRAEGIEPAEAGFFADGIGRIVLWLLFAAALVFLVSQILAYLRTRRRAERRRAQFDQRKASLVEWCGLLSAEVRDLTSSQHRLSFADRDVLEATGDQVATAHRAIEQASAVADLDANEIRIARSAMKLRTLRGALTG